MITLAIIIAVFYIYASIVIIRARLKAKPSLISFWDTILYKVSYGLYLYWLVVSIAAGIAIILLIIIFLP